MNLPGFNLTLKNNNECPWSFELLQSFSLESQYNAPGLKSCYNLLPPRNQNERPCSFQCVCSSSLRLTVKVPVPMSGSRKKNNDHDPSYRQWLFLYIYYFSVHEWLHPSPLKSQWTPLAFWKVTLPPPPPPSKWTMSAPNPKGEVHQPPLKSHTRGPMGGYPPPPLSPVLTLNAPDPMRGYIPLPHPTGNERP
jgi:hypothetical protein